MQSRSTLPFGRVLFFTLGMTYALLATAAVVATATAVGVSRRTVASASGIAEQKDDDKENAPIV